MAYATRPQYGAPPRPYHGPYTAPLTVLAEYQEPTYYTQTKSSDIHPYPGLISSQKSLQCPPNGVGFSEESSEQRNHNLLDGYSESFDRVQVRRPQGGNTQRPEYIGGPENYNHPAAVPYSQLGAGYQQSFSRPRKRQPQLSSKVQSPQLLNEPSRPMIPPPRSLSNESYPRMRSTPQSEGQNYTSFFNNDSNYESGASLSNTKILGNDGNNTFTSTRAIVNKKKPTLKERIIIERSSPETISWDNPFPTFPTPKKKIPPPDVDKINRSIASINLKKGYCREDLQSQELQATGGKTSLGSFHSNDQAGDGEPHQERRFQTFNANKIYHLNGLNREGKFEEVVGPGRLRYDLASKTPTAPSDQHFFDQPRARPMQHFINQAHISTSSSLPQSTNPSASERSGAIPDQSSDSLPASCFHVHTVKPPAYELPVSLPDLTEQTGDYSLPYQTLGGLELRPASDLGSQFDKPKQGGHIEQAQQPLLRQNTHIQESSYSPNEYFPQQMYVANNRSMTPKIQEFSESNKVPFGGQSKNFMINQDLQIPIKDSSHRTPSVRDTRGLPGTRVMVSGSVGQVYRSRSQPNFREQHLETLDHDHSFDFGNIPEIPGMPPVSSQSSRGPPLDRATSSRTDGLNQLDLQPSASKFERSQFADLNYAPNLRPHSPNRGPMASSGGRSIEVNQTSSMTLSSQSGSPSQAPSALVQAQRTPYKQGRSPGSGTSPMSSPANRSYNSDALPEHPAPVRPGLISASAPNQAGKPPPIRQYESIHHPPQQSKMTGLPETVSSERPSQKPKTISHQELERLRQAVLTNPNDHKTQLALAKSMVEGANLFADDSGRADLKQRNKNREKLIFDAYKLVKKLVSYGYPEAMFYLADCHGRGLLGLETDHKEAFGLYQSAAKAGHPQSAYRLAVCCEMGQEEGGGTRRDPLKAIQWYKRAATLGDIPAMYKMGMIQLKGLLGQSRNPREAIVWLKRAAERADEENPHALHELGLLFETASGNDNLIRDEAYSKQLFTQAADLGYKFSQYRLGSAYEYGLLGCPIDTRQSIAWYSKAAIQEEHQSELALSGWFLTGSEGVLQQSDTEAYLWARKAAQAGLAKAEYAMGYFTEVGIGTPANIEDAKRWYWRAASQNFPKARERLEDLRKGGARMQKSRVSRSAVSRQSDSDCIIM